MTLIINPGSGPVRGAGEGEARAAMEAFVADLGEGWETTPIAVGPEKEGRWPFEVVHSGHRHEVEMPGLPVDRVRYTNEDGQNIWDFPRLYVDGSSWVWRYALDVLLDCDEEADS